MTACPSVETALKAHHMRHHGSTDHADSIQQRRVPPVGESGVHGRFTDDHLATRPHKSGTKRQRDIGRAETSGNHRIKTIVPELKRLLNVHAQHHHAIGQIEASHHPRQEIGPFGPSIDHGDVQVRPIHCDDQSGNTSTRADVHDGAGDVSQCVDEVSSVGDDLVDGSVSQKAEALGCTQRLKQLFVMFMAHRVSVPCRWCHAANRSAS